MALVKDAVSHLTCLYMKPIDIVIVDDHRIFRDGLTLNIKEFPEKLRILAEAENAESLFEILDSVVPDVLLLDYHLPDMTGVQIAKRIRENLRWAPIKIIILSAHKSGNIYSNCYEFVIKAIDEGVNGYLLKDSSIEEILRSIEEVTSGNSFVLGETFDYKEVTKSMIKDRNRLISFLYKSKNFGLSKREIEVIKYLAKGLSAKEIGASMNISEDSVTTHKDHIKQKLSEKHNITLRNNVEIVIWAIKNDIVEI